MIAFARRFIAGQSFWEGFCRKIFVNLWLILRMLRANALAICLVEEFKKSPSEFGVAKFY